MNMMKEKLHRLLYGFAAIAALAFAAGCSDDDPTENIDGSPVVTSASYTVDLTYPDDKLALFDITAEYTSPAGTKTEAITGTWSKTFDFESFPADFSLKVRLKLKEGVDLTKKDHYDLGRTMSRKMVVHYSDGSLGLSGDVLSEKSTMPVGADKIELYAERNSEDLAVAFTVDLNADRSDVVTTGK